MKNIIGPAAAPGAWRCTKCGRMFDLCGKERGDSADASKAAALCAVCRRKAEQARRQAEERRKNERRRAKQAGEHESFLRQLTEWHVVQLDELKIKEDDALYIIGNGFDLMHRVPARYYDFRDFLGEDSFLREQLEHSLTDEDIWADLETSLGHPDITSMSDSSLMDMFLDTFGAYDDDAGAAEMQMAVDAMVFPLQVIGTELQPRFLAWTQTLTVGTPDRPLKGLFGGGRVLCFNYTEFVETLYGVPRDRVCYIHGCRRQKKGQPPPQLVLGHASGASDAAFEAAGAKRREPESYRQAMIHIDQDRVLEAAAHYDRSITKNCASIIKAHRPFFDSLKNTTAVVTVGHSFSPVDWDYFAAVRDSAADPSGISWYFGCYGPGDLVRLEQMLAALGIAKEKVTLFRTDTVTTAPAPAGQCLF